MRLLVCSVLSLAAFAAPPPLRRQVSLNGTWDKGGVVPVYEGIRDFDQVRYERTVNVPAEWRGGRVLIEFENVAFVADVYVNEEHVGTHIGAWNPFTIDVTKWGSSFKLRVDVKGPKHAPIVDERGAPQWPVGGWFSRSVGGIAGDVWLRGYGEVYIEDAFIQTSFRQKRIDVEYTLVNTTARPRNLRLAAAASGPKGRTFPPLPVALKANERKVVTLSGPWPDPELWWPDRPSLYQLRSQVIENGTAVDEENRRFGFREIWIEGNQLRFNGVRANLFGDYQVFGDTWYTQPVIHKPENWPATVDKIKSMNIRILRWHHNPVPQYLLDITDEKGLLICDEAANYARDYNAKSNQPAYLANTQKWIEAWIKADRNHPSVYMWNATNEMSHKFAGPFQAADLHALGIAIRKFDPTRPVGYDGDEGVAGEMVDYHYPEGYNKEPQGSIYGWAHLVQRNRPTGSGEMLHTRSPLKEVQLAVERNTWWLGIWLRGLRYTGWTNVKPACYWFAEKDNFEGPRAANLRNALAPVALFDKEYDDLGVNPYVTGLTPGGVLPALPPGLEVTRTLILYNDDFRDSAVTAEVELRQNGASYAKAERAFTIAPGEHVEFPGRFVAPGPSGGSLELILRTYKGGQMRFEEVRRFRLSGHGNPVDPPKVIWLGQ